jgi:hypothetical protein
MSIKAPNLNEHEAWKGGGMLTANPDGSPKKHHVQVLEAVEGESSGHYPQIAILWGNEDGQIRDWVVVKPPDAEGEGGTFGKVVAVYEALNLPVPKGKNATIDASKWIGRWGVIIVGWQKDRKGDMRDRVIGYAPAGTDVPVASPTGGSSGGKEDDIPFAPSVI